MQLARPCGRDLPPDHPLVKAGLPLHGPNQWPSGLPGWKETMQEGYGALSRLGREIMHAFALALELPESYFDRWLTGPMATLGPLHYPPQSGRITEARIGAGAHTDFGCLTIVAQDPIGGLQVRNSGEHGIFLAQVDGDPSKPASGNTFSGVTVSESGGAGLRVNDASCVNNLLVAAQLIGNNGGCVSVAVPGLVQSVGIICR